VKPIFLYLIFTVFVAGWTDPELLLNGPGTELYVKDTTERARHEEEYFRLICLGDCHDNPDTWLKAIYVGLNDIDDRCDAYISSLRRAKTEGDTYISLLTRTASTTNVILGQSLDTKTDARAISIVQAAFGLGTRGLSDYYSRLLLAIPPTTVHQIALKRRTAFRTDLQAEIRKDRRTVKSRSDSYFVIRSYLQICLPQSLEASIEEGLEDLSFRPPHPEALKAEALEEAIPVARRVDPDVDTLSTLKTKQ
jgi:hypothetical protein